MVVKSIGVLSVGKVMGCLYAIIGLLIGGMFSLISLLGFAASSGKSGGSEGGAALLFGVGAVIVLPIFYGICGFIGGIISSALYNLIASMVGGIEIDLSQN